VERSSVGGLYFASTTSPYREKQAAALAAIALDLPRRITTADFGDSLRCGTTALRAALDAVKSGSAPSVLVTASDCRLGATDGDLEQIFGDGAAALLVGDSGVIAAVEDVYTHSEEFVDLWRRKEDDFVRTWEERFIITQGYTVNVQEAAMAILKKNKLTPQEFAKIVFYAPDPRTHLATARGLGVDVKTQVQDPMFDRVGNTGCAFAPMMLVAALEQAKPGDRILLVSYGDGCDAFILRVTEEIEKLRQRRGVKGHLTPKGMLPYYGKYLRYRQLTEREAPRRESEPVSAPIMWRDRKAIYSLYGHKCRQCGTLQFPLERVCHVCKTRDDFEPVRLSDRKGEVFTYAVDHIAATIEPPTIMSVLDLEGGCRFYCPMTDATPQDVQVGMPVELTFRKFHDTAGLYHYFWKCRPVR
jgi:3-hydroxy-3-methylglutaryl CoA synthase